MGLGVDQIIPLIVSLRGDVWTLWGLLAAFNTAAIGWLIDKGATLSTQQRSIATAGYVLFCGVIAIGFTNAYDNLQAGVRELDHAIQTTSTKEDSAAATFAPGGLVQSFHRKNYRGNRIYALSLTGLSLAFITYLIWKLRI